MSNRITQAVLEAKVGNVNYAIGLSGAPAGTEGLVTLYSAYGATRVAQYAGRNFGLRDLSPLGTKRECAQFLDGMLAGLRLGRGE